ncbi:MAG: LysR family transcriptional regulator [Xanthobacteraceae bacterium]|nr:LysR family transcriptional regulator [Xanthobacteraceae bacterium]
MDWDLNDVRHFLAVARTGSTLAASKALGVNQTTCARRIAALEGAIGLTLFERAASGYRLTPSGSALVGHAEHVEAASARMIEAAQELARAGRAEIRFSTSDVLADLVAGPAIAGFAREHPDISVVFNADSRAVDLATNEADVALRAAPVMDDPQLVVRKVMDTPWAFYCATSWALDHSVPATAEDVARYPLATLEGRPAAMLRGTLPGAKLRYASNSMKALVEVIKTGECIGALPMLVGEQQRDLRRCFVLDIDAGGLWIVFHQRHRQATHIRAFVDHLAAFILTWRRGLQTDAGD